MSFASRNPATGQVLRSFESHGPAEVAARLLRAARGFATWRRVPAAQRADGLSRIANVLGQRREPLARLCTLEMGKPIRAALAEIDKCAAVCRYYAAHGETMLADQPARPLPDGAQQAFVRTLPLGPVLAVMPWNFPFWQVFRFAAPALMVGNVGLLKHAANVPQCALAIEDVVREAGVPDGAFLALLIEPERLPAVIADPAVAAVTLTGSPRAGAEVAAAAGRALKKTVLELGGSDPFIVMPSADVERAAAAAAEARLLNAGQSCIAAKRFFVHKDVHERFTAAFAAAMQRAVVGDPERMETEVGPLATEAIRAGVSAQLQDAVQRGGRVVTGGEAIDGPGFFHAPTLLTDVPAEAQVWREEVFGPVAVLTPVDSLEHAIARANDSVFGLGSSVWTHDADEQRRCIDELECGITFFNAVVASSPSLAFGGVKHSGYGRELGPEGLRAFANEKAVLVAS